MGPQGAEYIKLLEPTKRWLDQPALKTITNKWMLIIGGLSFCMAIPLTWIDVSMYHVAYFPRKHTSITWVTNGWYQGHFLFGGTEKEQDDGNYTIKEITVTVRTTNYADTVVKRGTNWVVIPNPRNK